MMMRGNFETSVYKPMKIAQFDRVNPPRPAAVAIAWPRRPNSAAWIAAALLGAAGAAAMSLMLSLLFARG